MTIRNLSDSLSLILAQRWSSKKRAMILQGSGLPQAPRFSAGQGVGQAFKITAAGGSTVTNTTDTMTLDEIEGWISEHIKAKR
jgi:hypothetical protein